MTVRRRWVNLGVFVLMAAALVWWVAQNWGHTAAGGAASGPSAGVQAAAAVDGVPVAAASARSGAPAATGRTPAGSAAGGASGAGVHGTSGLRAPTPASSGSGKGSAAASSAADYFAAAHLQRQQAESRELDQLEAMAGNAAATVTVRAQAQAEILRIEEMQREESVAEMVLKAKGFSQSIVLLSSNGAVVVVESSRFDAARAAAVAQAVAEVASLQPDQVQIVARH